MTISLVALFLTHVALFDMHYLFKEDKNTSTFVQFLGAAISTSMVCTWMVYKNIYKTISIVLLSISFIALSIFVWQNALPYATLIYVVWVLAYGGIYLKLKSKGRLLNFITFSMFAIALYNLVDKLVWGNKISDSAIEFVFLGVDILYGIYLLWRGK